MLTKLKLALLIAAPLVAGATTYAAAHGNDADRQTLIQKFDTNGDGKLDDNERAQMKAAFAAKRAERQKEALAKYDTNKDGQLDATERKAMRDDKLTTRFQAMDKDGDGKLSLAEFKAGAGPGMHRHARHGHPRSRG
jgi:Ca2+-binding EF-hand superfamily protein